MKIATHHLVLVGLASTLHVSVAQNDLNLALQYVISKMNDDGFFLEAWTEHHRTLPIPVPNDCEDTVLIPRETADESLTSVLDRGTLRIGLNDLAAGIPMYYSSSPNAADPTDLAAEPLVMDGYEPACAREGARVLGEVYNTTVEPEWIIIHGETYFEPVRDALDNDEIDVSWTGMFPTDDRRTQVDFTCSTFYTDQVIAAGDGVGKEPPPVDGPPVPVACVRGFCLLEVPPPFYMEEQLEGTTDAVYRALTNTTDGIDYGVFTYEQLGIFFMDVCNGCEYVDIDPLESIVRLPATKMTVRTSPIPDVGATGGTTADDSTTTDESSCPTTSAVVALGMLFAATILQL